MDIPVNVNCSGRVAVVTGGGGILCGMFARALARCGAKLAVLDLHRDKAEAVARKIQEEGGVAMALEANVLERESLARAEKELTDNFGPCDILINGAGGNHPRGTTTKEFFDPADLDSAAKDIVTFFDLDPDGVRFVFDLNFMGTLLATQVFARSMVGLKGATIINISSMNAFCPLTKIPAYSGAKAAINNFTQWLAVHMARTGIRVNAIAPGFFLTEQNRALLVDDKGALTTRAEKIMGQTPMGRFGRPEELLGTLLWLVDEASSGFITGVVIPVDGGFLAYSGV